MGKKKCPNNPFSRLLDTIFLHVLIPLLQTGVFSITVGLACTFYAPSIVIQAVVITAGVVTGLTAYTFWATRRGVEFTWMGPLLFSALWAMIIWGFLQIFFHPGPVAQTIYSLLGALLFCGYIVFDVNLLATRMDLDDYVWASVSLYLVSQF